MSFFKKKLRDDKEESFDDYVKARKEAPQERSGKEEDEAIRKGVKLLSKPKKEKKTYKESNLMKGRSDLKKVGDKYAVETELNIKKGLEPKVKKALKKSIVQEAEEKIKGSGIRRKIKLDMESSSEDEKPKKGKGFIDEDSSSDEEDLSEYSKILKHLISHITDKKEKIDPKDIKQAKELIDRIKSKKK